MSGFTFRLIQKRIPKDRSEKRKKGGEETVTICAQPASFFRWRFVQAFFFFSCKKIEKLSSRNNNNNNKNMTEQTAKRQGSHFCVVVRRLFLVQLLKPLVLFLLPPQ